MGLEDGIDEEGEGFMFEGDWLTEQLQEKLTVKRHFYERAIDWARGLTLQDIRENKYITGLTIAIAAFIIAVPSLYRARIRDLAESADAKTHLVAPAIDSSSIDSYMDEISEAASMSGVPQTALEAMLYAAKNCPEYSAFAKASGRAGIIPLDPAAAGVRPEILENDDELCLQVAAEMYRRVRSKTHTDVEALAVMFSSWKKYEDALAKARQTELEYHGSRLGGSDSRKENILKHEATFKLLEKHKKGEVTDYEYWCALVSYGGNAGVMPLSDSNRKKWKKEFEKAIAAGNETSGKEFVIAPKRYPGIRLMTDEDYRSEKARFDTFEDFTTRLPKLVAKVVNLARAYLHK